MTDISGSTQILGLVGNPLEHSLSPQMHNAAFSYLGLNWAYLPFAVHSDDSFRQLISVGAEIPFVGLNITMPYKYLAYKVCKELSLTAQRVQSVNTITFRDGQLYGSSTDGAGIVSTLAHQASFDPEGSHVVVLGAGPTARAALDALALAGANEASVVSRDRERANALCEQLSPCSDTSFNSFDYETAADVVSTANLIIDATPLGMKASDPSPIPKEWITKEQIIMDTVYGQKHTSQLLRDAQCIGARAFDGLGMLVEQGALSLGQWAGLCKDELPRETMWEAARNALTQKEDHGC